MSTRTKIPQEAKIAIVGGLACFDSLAVVAADIKNDFGIVVSPQAIEAHDPTKHAGRKLAAKWRELFEATRSKFIEDTSTIPIAHKATRLRMLNRMAVKAEQMNNMAMAAKLLEQAAKEMGNAFTNKVDLTSSDGSMSPPSLSDFYGGMVPGTVIFGSAAGPGREQGALIEGNSPPR
ncbi:MAG: DUF2280 domain-containing protein [Novosphingobium sp.]